jgi:hypothetical protein
VREFAHLSPRGAQPLDCLLQNYRTPYPRGFVELLTLLASSFFFSDAIERKRGKTKAILAEKETFSRKVNDHQS